MQPFMKTEWKIQSGVSLLHEPFEWFLGRVSKRQALRVL